MQLDAPWGDLLQDTPVVVEEVDPILERPVSARAVRRRPFGAGHSGANGCALVMAAKSATAAHLGWPEADMERFLMSNASPMRPMMRLKRSV
eukprot:scaffold124868_cov28-Tisochrysis_lutea.AAC.4